ncbi:chromosomal replication initiator protein DnaA [Streptobacillus moniliformis]|uniref:Chromosomal replication initiator protein DnaA n=1 Tax=Streptobacillus moniliformis (strain ATCC 14647 / DSM 12112 / NCTC 10651 / 9901) TaxID=519441 RepID=D1AW25_STRM9|nr:chromosomal replication initiator protein DnaA [Streptobacillus moniliformis]ACZ00501.1 Chromosomal replication initiator DnaA [Streptobacillus moniliformis DSM 12112]AVL43080.1 chromosomal replication initiator protein DnaA [Streptobacillus moniliformis]QXW65275.1 chromosomal replication initiator protein DnaA [Streptobacillus moniliformis]SQA12856.1 Chromosomal replication initiator protein DnaA [Streptobacillus moniliformis]
MLEPSKLWEALKKTLEDNQIIFSDYISHNVRAIDFSNSTLVLQIDDYRSYIEIDNIKSEIEKKANQNYGALLGEISIELQKNFKDFLNPNNVKKERIFNNLNKKFTFNNYVIGDNNLFAYKLGMAILDGKLSNSPLMIYGDSGLGKTHLAQAIGNEMIEKNPESKVFYTTSTEFSNELIKSFSERTTISFKDKYADLDMLIVDDIQFFENIFGKGDDKIQKEFYNAFNTLHMANKPIILISDKYPEELTNVEARLISRLVSGALVELKMPDKTSRISIIKTIITKENIPMDQELMYFIADELETNIRELEGFVNTIVARAKLMNEVVNKKMIIDELNKKIIRKKCSITSDKILDTVSVYYNIEKSEILGKSRKAEIVRARDASRYLLTNILKITLGEIGKMFGSDHTSIVKALEKIRLMETEDPSNQLLKDIKTLKSNIES